MDRVPFPWTEELSPKKSEEKDSTKSPNRNYLYIKVCLGLTILLLLIAFLRRAEKEKPALDNDAHLTGVVSMLALPKGAILDHATLKEAPLLIKSLTKTQLRQVLEAGDIPQTHGKLRAKKDIPPNKFILWTDLEIL